MSTNHDPRKRFWHFHAMMFAVPVLVAMLLTDTLLGSSAMGLGAPSLAVPEVGYYCNAIFPNGGWNLIWSGIGDGNANTCVGANGATTVRTGSFLAFGKNRIDLSCDGYSKGFSGIGTIPFSAAFQDGSGKGNCLFTVTMGSDTPRQAISTPGYCSPACSSGMACRNARCVQPVAPSSTTAWTFHADRFWSTINSKLSMTSVGYQASVYGPSGAHWYWAAGSATGSAAPPLKPTTMDATRRMEIASNSKTISAMALIAAIADLKGRSPSLNLNVDSLIWKYLPATWTIPASSKEITFRDLLQHTSGLNPSYNVKTYGDCKKLIQSGRTQSRGKYAYHNANYSLMRIIIPYVVDGPQAYNGFSDAALDDYTTAAYRQYVRGRILDPIGLTDADTYWTGSDPVTVLFDSTSSHHPATNRVNVFLNKPTTAVCGNCIDCPGSCGGVDLDETPNLHVREAGAGRWELSADEYALLMSKFWSGAIIPIDDMLGDNAVAYGGGMGNTQVSIPGRGAVTRYGHGGAGAFVQTSWITMAGYTAVVHSNTGLTFSLSNLVESAMSSAFMP